MQTRRDQLQAYRFQNRRALAALVTGHPNVLEPPMRRLTVTTLSGIMIAIIIAIVFGVIAIIHPSAGDSWKTSSAVIVDQDNNSTYVYFGNTLHPVLNYTSAVLAINGNGSTGRVQVSSSDIAGARYGTEIGIPDAPSALPASSLLVSYPMSSCSVQSPDRSGQAVARVTLHVGEAAGHDALAASQGLVVATASHPHDLFVLTQGRRLALPSLNVASALGLNVAPVIVGTAFLDSVPTGTPLAPPHLPGTGTTATYPVDGSPRAIGTVVATTDPSSPQYFVVLRAGLAPLDQTQLDLLSGSPRISVSTEAATAATQAPGQNDLTAALPDLPATPPKNDTTAAQRTGVCAVYRSATTTPTNPSFTVTGQAPASYSGTVSESAKSQAGEADDVAVPATKGVLATPANDPHTVLIVSDQGIRYSFASTGLLAGFGYTASDIVKMPPQLIPLIPYGSGLSTSAARQPVAR